MAKKISTTGELVRKAQDGDREALETLFAKAYPDLLQAARFRIGAALRTRMEAQDLVQTAFYEALCDLSQYRYLGKGSFYRWLLSILENKIRNRLSFLKAKRRDLRREVAFDPERPIPAPTSSPTVKLVARENRERLERAMDQLPEGYRKVIICHYYLRMPWREIGEHMGLKEEAAQMLCRRALLKLKQIYERKL
ncbi:MAG: sigma-70 family RNA polymerase sigma factor [Planctomycetes bacterium]|nr:sigma-70 family RNA polymerase sigma factor [Planctomycetota bacterium]